MALIDSDAMDEDILRDGLKNADLYLCGWRCVYFPLATPTDCSFEVSCVVSQDFAVKIASSAYLPMENRGVGSLAIPDLFPMEAWIGIDSQEILIYVVRHLSTVHSRTSYLM